MLAVADVPKSMSTAPVKAESITTKTSARAAAYAIAAFTVVASVYPGTFRIRDCSTVSKAVYVVTVDTAEPLAPVDKDWLAITAGFLLVPVVAFAVPTQWQCGQQRRHRQRYLGLRSV